MLITFTYCNVNVQDMLCENYSNMHGDAHLKSMIMLWLVFTTKNEDVLKITMCILQTHKWFILVLI